MYQSGSDFTCLPVEPRPCATGTFHSWQSGRAISSTQVGNTAEGKPRRGPKACVLVTGKDEMCIEERRCSVLDICKISSSSNAGYEQ
ncbi:hypothetical protein P7K49_029650 [Saguinus oedipus]|uniref:Uncharacterized protein n=1 Tax=Saguinus oedipus TaxID=9490 RepID=A0ABQ9U7V7_SAGOE|nr:hypothetical protein P7K49_029650 [Saguinus oedipus]